MHASLVENDSVSVNAEQVRYLPRMRGLSG